MIEKQACRADVAFGALDSMGKDVGSEQGDLAFSFTIADRNHLNGDLPQLGLHVAAAFAPTLRIPGLARLPLGVNRRASPADRIIALTRFCAAAIKPARVSRRGLIFPFGLRHHAVPRFAAAEGSPVASGAPPPVRSCSISSKVLVVSASVADLPVKHCQRRIATSTKTGSISMARARRPVRSAATKIVPEPANGSRTMPWRREQSLMASATRATGLTVGCMASSSSRPRRIDVMPAYSHTLVRLRPC